jgi:hypothetical protein
LSSRSPRVSPIKRSNRTCDTAFPTAVRSGTESPRHAQLALESFVLDMRLKDSESL